MPAAGPILAFASFFAEGGLAIVLATAATAASFLVARHQQKKAARQARAARDQSLLNALLGRRQVRVNGIFPRQRVYGEAITAGVVIHAQADRAPESPTELSRNSYLVVLSDRPIDKFQTAWVRELPLADFAADSHSDTQLLSVAVPAQDGPPKLGAGDVALYAFVGAENAADALTPQVIYTGDGKGVQHTDKAKFLTLGCAWLNIDAEQTDPQTNEGLSSVGAVNVIMEMRGTRVRDWRRDASGREIFAAVIPRSEPAAGVVFSAGMLLVLEEQALFAAKDISGFHVLGLVGTEPSVSGRINQNVFILGNDGAKSVRDNLLAAAGVAVVDEPVAEADEVLVGGASGVAAQADAGSASAIPLPVGRSAQDYVGMRFVFKKGEEVATRFLNAFSVNELGGFSLGFAGGEINISADAVGTSVTWDYVNADGSAATDSAVLLTDCIGVAPLAGRRGSALTAWRAFLASAGNLAAVNQLHLVCRENTDYPRAAAADYGRFTWGRYAVATDYSDYDAVSEQLWFALPAIYTANPVVLFMDWIMDAGRPVGFSVNVEEQLALLEDLGEEADVCDEALVIGRYVLSEAATETDDEGKEVIVPQSSYDYIGNREREVEEDGNRFVVLDAAGNETVLSVVSPGINFGKRTGSEEGTGSFVHGGVTYKFRWRVDNVFAGHEPGGLFGLAKKTTYRPEWSVDLDRFNADILLRTQHGDIAPTPRSLDLDEALVDLLAASFCVVPVIFYSVTNSAGAVLSRSARLEETSFIYAPGNYEWDLPDGHGTVSVVVSRLASGTLTTAITTSAGAGFSNLVVQSAHFEVCARRYEFSGVLDMGESERENMRQFEEATVGKIYDEGLAVRFRVGRWRAPVAVIKVGAVAPDAIMDAEGRVVLGFRGSEVQIARDPQGELEDSVTGMRGAFLDRTKAWTLQETKTVEDKVALALVAGVETVEDVTLLTANTRVRATVLLRQMLAARRDEGDVVIGPLRLSAEFLHRDDRVVLSMPHHGFEDETFRVARVRPEGEKGVFLILEADRADFWRDEFWTTAVEDSPAFFTLGALVADDGGELLADDGEALTVE